MPDTANRHGAYLVVCLNPTIQKSLVFKSLAKGEVNRTSDYRVDVSGKGVNVARVLGQLGRTAMQLTQLGGPTREWFLAMCAADGLDLRWVESGSEIRFCTTVLDKGEGSATELVEESRAVEAGTAARILDEYDRLLPEVATVMLSGTKAAGFPPPIMPAMAERAAAAGKRLFLDIKGQDLLGCLPYRPLVVKPNLEELLQTYAPEKSEALRLVGSPAAADEDAMRDLVARVGREYKEKYGAWLVVTRGSSPTLYWDGARGGSQVGREVIGSDRPQLGLGEAAADG